MASRIQVKINFEPHPIGKGEELPPGIKASSPVSDPKRRICDIVCTLTKRSQKIGALESKK